MPNPMINSHNFDGIINWKTFTETRNLMGDGFVRILGYFREDGMKSVAAAEQAFREQDSTKLVLPAHTLKGEAWQFGAEKLAELAEQIELTARHCVESREDPSELVQQIAALRPLFEQTLAQLDAEVSPLAVRRPANGINAKAFGNRG